MVEVDTEQCDVVQESTNDAADSSREVGMTCALTQGLLQDGQLGSIGGCPRLPNHLHGGTPHRLASHCSPVSGSAKQP